MFYLTQLIFRGILFGPEVPLVSKRLPIQSLVSRKPSLLPPPPRTSLELQSCFCVDNDPNNQLPLEDGFSLRPPAPGSHEARWACVDAVVLVGEEPGTPPGRSASVFVRGFVPIGPVFPDIPISTS